MKETLYSPEYTKADLPERWLNYFARTILPGLWKSANDKQLEAYLTEQLTINYKTMKCTHCKSENITEEITVCKYCYTPIENIWAGTEGWFYCSECEMIEPDTIEANICKDCYTAMPELS